MHNRWQPVIGLEIHAQLATQSKIFSGASTAYGAEPNTQACAVDLGMPGTLPVPNREAFRLAVRFGLAVNATVAARSIFARKNYFYPDLPKGYQISQYELPIVVGGMVPVRLDDGREIAVELIRAHLEEDAGKSLHEEFQSATGLDLNRAGIPLLEIVTAPVMHSAQEAVAYMRSVHTLLRWLGICDGNMQEGSFRCDANVSVRPEGESVLGTRTEIKNVNSFRFVEKAIEYEVERQIRAIESGEAIVQETRLYDAAKNQTRSMRGKESAHDYRYFPDPDLPPLIVSPEELAIERQRLPELPNARRQRYMAEHGLSDYDASSLCNDKATADYFESVLALLPGQAKLCANWVLGELSAALNESTLAMERTRIPAEELGRLLRHIVDGSISGKIAKSVFASMWATQLGADAIIEREGLKQISNPDALAQAIADVLTEFPKQLADYRAGQEKLFQFFLGQVMKRTRGQANPQQLNDLLRQKLHPQN